MSWNDLVVGNGAAWDRFEPRTNIQLNFFPLFKSVLCSFHFPLLERTLKSYFSYVKIIFQFCLIISYIDHDDPDAFSLFLRQRDFDIFHVLLFKVFLFFLIIIINHFYICIRSYLPLFPLDEALFDEVKGLI